MKKLSVLLLFAAALFVSCEQQDQPFSQGKAVTFSATSKVGTKTAYSGKVLDGKEAILWENNDVITVWCNQATVYGGSQKYADYKISTTDGVTAKVTPVSAGVELLWGEDETHKFYASYGAKSLAASYVTATISATQTVKESGSNVFVPVLSDNGVMVAAAEANPSDGSVSLTFKPIFTTLQFTVSSGVEDDVEITGFSLKVNEGSKATLCGNFSATLSTTKDPVISVPATAGQEISVAFGTSGKVTLKKDETLTFSVIALPTELTDLVAVFTVNAQEISVPLKKDGAFIRFAAGKKSRITALGVLKPEEPTSDPVGINVDVEDQGVDDYDMNDTGNTGGDDTGNGGN